MSVVGEQANVDVASVNGGGVAAEEFVEPEGCGSDEDDDYGDGENQGRLVAASFGEEDGTG